MNISQRITGLTGGGSDGWDVFYKARAMVAGGTAVTELTIGEHDIRTDQSILDAMHRSASGGHTGYAMVPGVDALRDAVAARVGARTGVATTRDNIMITPGGQSALFAAHHAVCDEGDIALYCDPFYATYPGTLRALGLEPRSISCRPEAAFQPSFADIAAKSHSAKSLLVNTPNNPTGVVYSRDTVAGIARACVEYDMWCISDEVYDTQVWDGAHISPRAMDGMAERTLVVGSMSKSHAMTGSRVGWIVGPEAVIEHLITLATHTTYGVGLVPSSGAMYLMLDCRQTGLSGEDFALALLDRHHIAVMPGESFGAAAAGHVRVAMTVDDDAFAAALRILVGFAKETAQ